MANNHTYLALTIGPIVKTIQKARSTRGLWGSSFLISYLMRVICRNFVEHKRTADFVSPLVGDPRLFEPQDGAGLFPDQLILRYQEGDEKLMAQAIRSAIQSIYLPNSKRTLTAIQQQGRFQQRRRLLPGHPFFKSKNRDLLEDRLYQYMSSYFLFRAAKLQVPEGENVILKAKEMLASLEMQQPLPDAEEVDWLGLLLQNINETHLPGIAYADKADDHRFRFPSLIEIATSRYGQLPDLKAAYTKLISENLEKAKEKFKKIVAEKAPVETPDQATESDKTTEEDTLLTDLRKLLEKHSLELCQADKYIAIISADGDNMGKSLQHIFEQYKSMQALEPISKALLDFNIEAVNIIKEFGGKAIYLGGDDLLFFAPLWSTGEKTVFHLVESVSEAFEKHVHKAVKEKEGQFVDYPLPSLSFGVSLSYYKYPLFEAREVAENLLHKAKANKAMAEKNAVAFQLLKHSGHLMEAVLPKGGTSYREYFLKLLEPETLGDSFLSSVMHELVDSQPVLEAILTIDAVDQRKRSLVAFFGKQFNEGIHQDQAAFLNLVQQFLLAVYEEQKTVAASLTLVQATFALVQFLNQNEKDDD